MSGYCKFGNFRGKFNLPNNLKKHIRHAKNLRLGYDLPTSVNNIVISPFREGFIFMKLRSCKVSLKLTLAKISELIVPKY